MKKLNNKNVLNFLILSERTYVLSLYVYIYIKEALFVFQKIIAHYEIIKIIINLMLWIMKQTKYKTVLCLIFID